MKMNYNVPEETKEIKNLTIKRILWFFSWLFILHLIFLFVSPITTVCYMFLFFFGMSTFVILLERNRLLKCLSNDEPYNYE